MKIFPPILLSSFAVLLFLGSCVSQKKLTYLQYSETLVDSEAPVQDLRLSITPSAYKVMSYDNLFIRVITPDPQWSVLFNTTPVGQGGAMTEESASLVGYHVDEQGNIDIPFVGKVNVAGKTLAEIKHELDTVFRNYVNDASISVRLVNNYISILGEVTVPGRYPLTKDRLNVFEALSMAGDMREFSNRQKVQLIRPSAYGPIIKEFSLLDRSILSSEYYYLMPNDILYAKPLKGRSFLVNASVYTFLFTTITTSFVIIGFFR
jgi:polysaccharide biosynthesis/export protein